MTGEQFPIPGNCSPFPRMTRMASHSRGGEPRLKPGASHPRQRNPRLTSWVAPSPPSWSTRDAIFIPSHVAGNPAYGAVCRMTSRISSFVAPFPSAIRTFSSSPLVLPSAVNTAIVHRLRVFKSRVDLVQICPATLWSPLRASMIRLGNGDVALCPYFRHS